MFIIPMFFFFIFNFFPYNFPFMLLYKYWLHERLTWEITNVDQGEAEVDFGFRGVTISLSMLPSRSVNIYHIILNIV